MGHGFLLFLLLLSLFLRTATTAARSSSEDTTTVAVAAKKEEGTATTTLAPPKRLRQQRQQQRQRQRKQPEPLDYDTRFYDNTIDHVTPFHLPRKTFRHRYLVNDTYYGNGNKNIVVNGGVGDSCRGPIWFYTGNEGGIEGFWHANGFMQYLAVEYGGLLVMAEQRYYGKSTIPPQPEDNKNKYEFLTTQQVLEDYAELLRYVKQEYGAESCPVVAFGGSYGGTLSAYLRYAYPAVVQGALASSSELGYYDVEHWKERGVTEHTFSEIVARQYHERSPDCLDAIHGAAKTIDASEPSEVLEAFRFCDESALSTPNQSSYFVYGLEGLPQHNYPYPVGRYPAWPVNAVCDILLEQENTTTATTVLERAARVTALALGYSLNASEPCFGSLPEGGPGSVPGDGPGVGAWGYQSCTETLHEFSSSAASGGLRDYGFRLKPIEERCRELHGVVPDTRVLAHRYGGGFGIAKTTTNTIFSSGEKDPWGGAILGNANDTDDDRGVYFFRMPSAAHHLDLRGWNEADPPDVAETRSREEQIVVGWVRDYIAGDASISWNRTPSSGSKTFGRRGKNHTVGTPPQTTTIEQQHRNKN